jgi:SAM-dependent MidA family methyltransferase
MDACRRMTSGLAQTIYYVAADYEPSWIRSPDHTSGWDHGTGSWPEPGKQDTILGAQRVKSEGLAPFRNVVGCILCNELLDNFPVHRFAIDNGRVKEVFVTLAGEDFSEILDEPSSHCIEKRLASLDLSLPDGYRGEVNLAMEDWTSQITTTLDRGFVLTIDYGQLANNLYSPQNSNGTVVCFNQHVIGSDPYLHIGKQDITTQVDFTSLMQLGERCGLNAVGYTLQRHFLANLGFSSFLDALQTQSLSDARMELNRMAMMTLMDPDEYGDFKVLAQATGMGPGIELLGFEGQGA